MAELTDERIEDLVTDLRADVFAHIRPPGADVVHRTVRRRRNAASVAAVLAVVAVAGSTLSLGRSGLPDDRAPVEPVGHQRPPALDDRAAQALPPAPGPGDDRLVVARHVAFLETGPSGYQDVPFPYLEGVTPSNAPAGSYTIDVSCAGRGSVRVTVVSMPPTSGAGDRRPANSRATTAVTADVPCSDAPESRGWTVSQPTDGFLRVDVNAGSDKAGTAAVAFMITSRGTEVGRNVRRASEALAAVNPQVPRDRWMPQMDPPGTLAIARSSGGRRTAQVVCVGTGVVTVVTVLDDSVEIRTPITCDMTARVHTFAIPQFLTSFDVKSEVDAAGRDRAGYALLFPTSNG